MKLPFLESSDKAFFSQVANSDLRQVEISRLSRIRRNLFLVAAFLFFLGIASTLFYRGNGTPFPWIIFLLEVLAFYDAQNRLRLLQLAERIQSGR
ncbi:MAG TPA: hypothetical protein VIT91_16955 [Chthoniobacterales bacterium]